jgi:GT2 family glycosyltransferase
MQMAPIPNFVCKKIKGLTRGCAVAVPVRDEAQRLPACLTALAAQRDKLGRAVAYDSFCVVIFANNCSDESAELARSLVQHLPFAVRIVEAHLPPAGAHAGGARRAAMDLAEAWLVERGEGDGVILTTDADSQVSPLWIANNLAAVDAGVDAVLGRVALDEEGDLLPQALHRRGRLESAYEALLTELSALLDPLDYNPWPHHATISGASLAITREAYRRVGGLPPVPLGEDKALIAELSRHDARIRFCPDVQVTTSGRLNGRAPGGVADTLRLRSIDPGAFCDETLEPFRVAIRRARWRARLRHLHQIGGVFGNGEWAASLGISPHDARRISCATAFGAVWSSIESASPLLARRVLTPAELPRQIAGARQALARLRKSALSARQHVKSERVMAIPTLDPHRLVHASDQELGSFVSG